mmetsp:Transcript_15155/g.21619  ORF Transcript_15155/g.21619 Transcript_15155/m.21619 type:complete len:80 (+) Transcript_15155:1618-1857(+)
MVSKKCVVQIDFSTNHSFTFVRCSCYIEESYRLSFIYKIIKNSVEHVMTKKERHKHLHSYSGELIFAKISSLFIIVFFF